MSQNRTMTGVRTINAITLATIDMGESVRFYEVLGFEVTYGGPAAPFTTLASGDCFVNLTSVDEAPPSSASWGRVIFHVDDVDALHARAVAGGLTPTAPPRDAPWGERMFPIFDPSGHDLSFAKRLR